MPAVVRVRETQLILRRLLCIGLGLALCQTGEAQIDVATSSGDKQTMISRIDSPPEIDGYLDDRVWQQIVPIDDLHEINPIEYDTPSERTEVRIAYDDNALYVAARLYDSRPDEITAQIQRQGEDIGDDDRFALIIDPHMNRRSGYRFMVNPNGVRWEALYSDARNLQSDWDGIWRAAATRDDQGWIAEMEIPFKTLSFNPDSDSWGINFERAVQRADETMAWVSRNRQANPGVAGTAVGFRDLQQGRGLDVVPSATARGQRSFVTAGADETELQPSLDVFYKITPSLNGALTFNTDFSATEIDDRQVNLTRFSLFFPEKRDFFLQDVDIFEFGRIGGGGGGRRGRGGGGGGGDQNGMPFFSRRIGLGPTGQPVDLNVGGKLSGRVGRFNIGALAVSQGGFSYDGFSGPVTVDKSEILVGRVTANILGESTVGVIMTDGDPQSDVSSQTVGTDFNYRNTRLPGGKVLEANAWYQQSDTEGVDDKDGAFGFAVSMPNNTGFRGGFAVKQIEENFDPAVGFVNQRGIRSSSGDLNYRIRYGDRFLRSVNFGISRSETEILATGRLDRGNTEVGFNVEFSTQDSLFFRVNQNEENVPFNFAISCPRGLLPEGVTDCTVDDGLPGVVIPAGSYEWDSLFMGMRSGNQRKIAAFVGIGSGDYYDGKSSNINSNIEWRPSSTLRLQIGYNFRDVELPDGNFQVRQSDFAVQYVFSPTLSWVNLIQYDNFSEVVGFNSRLHWIPEAGREGFIVFNHNVSDPDKNDSFHSINADLSVKFSYTIRF